MQQGKPKNCTSPFAWKWQQKHKDLDQEKSWMIKWL